MPFPVRPKHAERVQPLVAADAVPRPEGEKRASGPLLRFPGEGRVEEPSARPSLRVAAADRLVLSAMAEPSAPRRGFGRSVVIIVFLALAAIGAASIVHAVVPAFGG